MGNGMTQASGAEQVGAAHPAALSQGLASALGYGITSLATFFAVIGMIRIMGKAGFGQFSLAIQITAFSSMLADFGIGPVIMRRMAIEPWRSGGILADATVARLLLLAPTWLLTLGIGLALDGSWRFGLILNLMLVNTVISAKLPVLRGSCESFFRSQSRMGFPVMTGALDALALLALVVFLPGQFEDPVRAMLLYTACNLPGAVLMAVGSARLLKRVGADAFLPSRASVRALLVEAWPVAVFLLLNALHVSIDSIYLKVFRGDDAVGIYNAALRIMTPLAVFPTIVAVTAAPFIARASIDPAAGAAQTSRLFTIGLKTLLAGSILLGIFGAGNARLLLDLAFHGKYAEAAVPMALMFAAFIPMAVNMFLVEANNARAALWRNTRAAGLLSGVSLAAGPPLILAFGVTGAVLAKGLAIAATLAYFGWSMRAESEVRLPALVLRSAALLLSALPLLLLSERSAVLRNAAAVLVFVATLALTRFFTRAERDFWMTRIRAMAGRSG